MIDFHDLLESWWVRAFILNWMVCVFLYEFVVLPKVRPITHGDPELHKKYPGFVREDAHLFTNRLLYYLTVWTFTPKFILTAVTMIIIAVGCQIIGIGVDK